MQEQELLGLDTMVLLHGIDADMFGIYADILMWALCHVKSDPCKGRMMLWL